MQYRAARQRLEDKEESRLLHLRLQERYCSTTRKDKILMLNFVDLQAFHLELSTSLFGLGCDESLGGLGRDAIGNTDKL